MWWNHQLRRIHAITEERALRDARAAQQAAEVGAAHISPLLTVTNVLPRFDFTEIIVICAGEEQKEYLVHRSVLKTSSSKFLKRMLSNDWRETREKRLSLPETRPWILEVYLHWMYTGHVVLEHSPAEADTVLLVEIYLLGDYLDDMVFCDTIVEKLVELSQGPKHKLPSGTAVRLAWSKTSVDSPLRAVVKELFLGVAIYSALEALLNNDDFPYEFILDILSSSVENNNGFCTRSFLTNLIYRFERRAKVSSGVPTRSVCLRPLACKTQLQMIFSCLARTEFCCEYACLDHHRSHEYLTLTRVE
jgi:hypothetical protein